MTSSLTADEVVTARYYRARSTGGPPRPRLACLSSAHAMYLVWWLGGGVEVGRREGEWERERGLLGLLQGAKRLDSEGPSSDNSARSACHHQGTKLHCSLLLSTQSSRIHLTRILQKKT